MLMKSGVIRPSGSVMSYVGSSHDDVADSPIEFFAVTVKYRGLPCTIV